MKYFRMSYEEVLYRRSYLNIMLLNRSIPTYENDRGEETAIENGNKEREHAEERSKIDKTIHAANFFLGMMGG